MCEVMTRGCHSHSFCITICDRDQNTLPIFWSWQGIDSMTSGFIDEISTNFHIRQNFGDWQFLDILGIAIC